MSSDKPGQWLNDPSVDPSVRAALGSAANDGPSAEELAALKLAVTAVVAKGAATVAVSSKLASSATQVTLGTKVLVVATVVAAASGGFIAGRKSAPVMPPEVKTVYVPAAPVLTPVITPVPPEPMEPPKLPVPVPVKKPAPKVPVVAPVEEAPVAPAATEPSDAELALLDTMQTALRAKDYPGVLEAVRKHETTFSRGALVPEREMMAVEALTGVGRVTEARVRAQAFLVTWPTSTLLSRVLKFAGP